MTSMFPWLGRSVFALVIALPLTAFGQNTGTAPADTGNAPAAPAPATPAPPAPAAGTESAAPASSAPRPVREATGYAPESIPSAAGDSRPKARKASKASKASNPAATRTKTPRVDRKAQTGSFVVEPGFSLLDGGGSRFFVELGQSVPVEERKAKGSITFVLKGAKNAHRNNLNPLVTEHFNTPVRRAKLQHAGHDLLFVMELRQDVSATHQTVTNKEGHSVFQVDFAPGKFIKESAKDLPEPSAPSEPGTTDTNETIDRNGAGAGAGNRTGPKP